MWKSLSVGDSSVHLLFKSCAKAMRTRKWVPWFIIVSLILSNSTLNINSQHVSMQFLYHPKYPTEEKWKVKAWKKYDDICWNWFIFWISVSNLLFWLIFSGSPLNFSYYYNCGLLLQKKSYIPNWVLQHFQQHTPLQLQCNWMWVHVNIK